MPLVLKRLRVIFLPFWFAWPLFGIGLIVDYCETSGMVDKFFTNIVIKDKKND